MPAEQATAVSKQVDAALAAAAGGGAIWPGESKDVRVVKLPAGATHAWSEPGPNAANDNSAVVAVFQVRASGGCRPVAGASGGPWQQVKVRFWE
jgi:hypothetical protein